MRTLLSFLVAIASLTTFSAAHGSHADAEGDDTSDWATRHMREEHHISNFDPASFFLLHDYDNSGVWTPDEVRRTYGLDDESNVHVPEERKNEAVAKVFAIFDPLKTGVISNRDWMRLTRAGKRLPDLGYGPGHHGDMEYEYEIHHFEKFHGDDATEDELTHPEDIEHFRRHDEAEAAALRLEKLEELSIVESNIPAKFRKNNV